MKNLFKSLALTLLAAATFTSCEQDPCKDVVCGDQGQCVEGTCVCNAGYEKDANNLCNTEQRTKFLKQNANGTVSAQTYVVSDVCSNSGTSDYNTTISAGTASITEVRVTNFYGLFTNAVVATVDGNTITIARQQPDNDSIYVVGSGTISGTTITFSYSISDETDSANIVTDSCTATWVKS